MSLHIGKGRTVSTAISDILDYVENPEKTDGGRLISSYQCDSRIADAEFLFSKRQYIAKTGRRRGADDVLAYQIRQSFVPGEITPEDANRLGRELAMRFTKGKHAFIVCTHIDKAHVHNHIIWNSTTLDCTRKFRDFLGSGRAVRRLNDIVSSELWNAVQAINRAASLHAVGKQAPTPKLFSGKLFCADCSRPLEATTETQHRKNGTSKRYVSYFCSTYGRSGRSVCSWHRIYEQTLTQIVLAEIQAQAQAVTLNETAVVERLKRRVEDSDAQRLASTRQEISKLSRRVTELEALTAKLYEDKYSGAISEETFILLMQKNEHERTAKAERLDILLNKVDKAEKETAAIQNWAAIIRKYLNLQNLDRAVVDELIDHIEIGERTVIDGQRHQDIKIFYRFVGLVD